MISSRPRVSVIMAVYNAEKYLTRTLDSLAAQTYKNMEILFVEDGSTDASKAILPRYSVKDKRIRVLHQEYVSSNSSRAFNMGIDHANGDYVLLLNDYDIFEPDLVESTIKKAESTGADIVLFDAYLYDEDTDSDRFVDFYLNRGLLGGRNTFTPRNRNRDLYELTSGRTFTMLISRKLLNEHNIRMKDLDGAPDLEFCYLALSCADSVAVCYKRLVHNRRYADNNHWSRIKEWPETCYTVYMDMNRELKQRALYETYKIAFANKVMNEVEYYLKLMNEEEGFLKLYNALHEGYLHRLGVFEIPDRDFSTRRAVMVRNAIRDLSPVEYLLNVKDDIIEKERDFFRLPYVRNREEKIKIAFFGIINPASRIWFDTLGEDEAEVVCWADLHGNPEIPMIKDIDGMLELSPDYIFVMNPGLSYFNSVRQALTERGVDPEKIIPFR